MESMGLFEQGFMHSHLIFSKRFFSVTVLDLDIIRNFMLNACSHLTNC